MFIPTGRRRLSSDSNSDSAYIHWTERIWGAQKCIRNWVQLGPSKRRITHSHITHHHPPGCDPHCLNEFQSSVVGLCILFSNTCVCPFCASLGEKWVGDGGMQKVTGTTRASSNYIHCAGWTTCIYHFPLQGSRVQMHWKRRKFG